MGAGGNVEKFTPVSVPCEYGKPGKSMANFTNAQDVYQVLT